MSFTSEDTQNGYEDEEDESSSRENTSVEDKPQLQNVFQYEAKSYVELIGRINQLQGTENSDYIYILFLVDKIDEEGSKPSEIHSLCEEAEATVFEYLQYIPERRVIHLIKTYVNEADYKIGSDYWNDKYMRLRCVPKLVRWGGPQRICQKQCLEFPLLKLVFEEDEYTRQQAINDPKEWMLLGCTKAKSTLRTSTDFEENENKSE